MRREIPPETIDGLGARGLCARDVDARRERFGANVIVEGSRAKTWDLVRETAGDPMLWFLVGTSAVYALLRHWNEAGVLLASIIPLAGMDWFLHRRTQASTRGLRSRLATSARVLRDGAELSIPSEEIVVGDLALVRAGESFPADGVVLASSSAQVDESALTGESMPVAKTALEDVSKTRGWVESKHWGLAGTRVLTGEARVRIVAIGGETLYGDIVRSAQPGRGARTPLQVSIASLVRGLVVAATLLCIALALTRWRQGHGWIDAFLSSMTLAIAALPEECPVVFTLFLGVGVYRLARRKALVRRAVTVENIGRVTTICSDKTGTITEGRLRLVEVLPADGFSERELLTIALSASQDGLGDPLDEALVAFAPDVARPDVLERFPFTEDRKRATVIARDGDQHFAATKGSPETILALCGEQSNHLARERVLELAAMGRKVIACAHLSLPNHWVGGEPDRGFDFAGLLAFEDPVRVGIREAVMQCRAAGIRTMLVTGDHPATAAKIAMDIGLNASGPRVVLGDQLEARVNAHPLGELDIDVVARAIPAQKLLLVRALQARGEIVAVTGDGVNDVPALQAADIGIAMGERGTRSAREAAGIVLLDDNFATIVRAIGEGRQLFRNLQSSFQYLLMIHVPLVLTAAIIPLAGYPLVFLPIHVIWLELMIHPTAMLAFQELPPDVPLRASVQRARGAFFARAEWLGIASVGTALTVGTVGAYDWSLRGAEDVAHARALVVVALTCASAAVAIVLSRLRTPASRVVVATSLAVCAMLVQVPTIAVRLSVQPLEIREWVLAASFAGIAVLPLAFLQRRSTVAVTRDLKRG